MSILCTQFRERAGPCRRGSHRHLQHGRQWVAYVGRHQVGVGSLGLGADRSRLAGEVPCAWVERRGGQEYGEWGLRDELGCGVLLRDVPSLLFY